LTVDLGADGYGDVSGFLHSLAFRCGGWFRGRSRLELALVLPWMHL
jgi:hypothetical protein